MNEKSIMGEYYLNCFIKFLEALKVENIPLFIENLTPENCLRLGEEISTRISGMEKLKDEYKNDLIETERKLNILKKNISDILS